MMKNIWIVYVLALTVTMSIGAFATSEKYGGFFQPKQTMEQTK